MLFLMYILFFDFAAGNLVNLDNKNKVQNYDYNTIFIRYDVILRNVKYKYKRIDAKLWPDLIIMIFNNLLFFCLFLLE